jgi:transcriptional regulator with XRE-family HTH domain
MKSKTVHATMEDVRAALARNIKRHRKRVGLAQERLALEAGIDRTMLSKIERQIANPSVDTLLKLSNRLGLHIGVLFEAPEV